MSLHLYRRKTHLLTARRWSPLHELVPDVPLRHGHAISIDMAYSATLANSRGLLSDEEHKRLLTLFSRAGLSMDHHQFDEEILRKGTQAILKTRDGKLRAAVPSPLGKCVFLNDVSIEEMLEALRRHKKVVKEYARSGAGIDAFVDASDTGYTINNQPVESTMNGMNGAKKMNGANGANGVNGCSEVGNGSLSEEVNGTNGTKKGSFENHVNPSSIMADDRVDGVTLNQVPTKNGVLANGS